MNVLARLSGSLLLTLSVAASAEAAPSNKWRIEVDHTARATGEIELSFTPDGAPASSVVVAIPAGTGENAAARLIRTAIHDHFGAAVYHTEIDDGEDVLIKVRGSTRDFELVLIRNTADGLDLDLERE